VPEKVTGIIRVQTTENPQQRGFAAAIGALNLDGLSFRQVEIQVPE